MKVRGNTVTWGADDIADALGMPRNTPCARCRHGRYEHNHGKGNRADLEQLGSCQAWDRRTTTGYCKCPEWQQLIDQEAAA